LKNIKAIVISDEKMSKRNRNELRSMNIKTEVVIVKN